MSRKNVDLVLRAQRAASPPDPDRGTAGELSHRDHVFVTRVWNLATVAEGRIIRTGG